MTRDTKTFFSVRFDTKTFFWSGYKKRRILLIIFNKTQFQEKQSNVKTLPKLQAAELKYALGIPHIFCFEEWGAEQQQKPNKLIPNFAAES